MESLLKSLFFTRFEIPLFEKELLLEVSYHKVDELTTLGTLNLTLRLSRIGERYIYIYINKIVKWQQPF
jgi:hypothetical protein